MPVPPLLSRMTLTNYGGGDNPLLIYLALAGLILLGLIGLGIAVKKLLDQYQLHRILTLAELSNQEIGLLRGNFRRLRQKAPLQTVTSIGAWDRFLNRLAHHYGSQSITEEALLRDIDTFGNIRLKLGLKHVFNKKRLLSSRALPLKYPVTIIYTDSDSNETFRLSTKVVANNEFYLGIIPPEDQVAITIAREHKARFDISFQREKGNSYSFATRFIRSVNHPQTMWYIPHSDQLRKTKQANHLQIPGNLLVSSATEGATDEELNVNISVLDLETCVVESKETSESISPADYSLLSFDLDGSPLSLRGHIAQTLVQNDKQLIRINFSDLSEEERRALVRFRMNKKKESPKKAS